MSLINKKKKKGTTLVEVIIVMSIMTMIIGLLYPIFISGYRNLIKVSLDNDLKTSATAINKQLSETLVQATGIIEINDFIKKDVLGNPENLFLEEKVTDVSRIKVKTLKIDGTEEEYEFLLTDKYISGNKELYSLTVIKDGSSEVISKNIKSVTVESLESTVTLKNTSSIKITVELYDKKGLADSEYKIATILTFRNKA